MLCAVCVETPRRVANAMIWSQMSKTAEDAPPTPPKGENDCSQTLQTSLQCARYAKTVPPKCTEQTCLLGMTTANTAYPATE